MSPPPIAIAIFVFSSIGIAVNILVVLVFWKNYSIRAVTTRLIFFLHLSVLGEMISSLPIYGGNEFMCGLMGFASFYFGLFNALVTVMLTIAYYNIIQDNRPEIEKGIKKYGVKFAIIFPFITLLPFTTDSYQAIGNSCTLNLDRTSDIWSIFTFFLWMILALLFCTLLFTYIIYRASRFNTSGLRRRIFRCVGVYILITILCLIPRVVVRTMLIVDFHNQSQDDDNVSAESQSVVEIPQYFVGIAYAICFFANQQILKSYESHQTQDASDELQFTVEELDAVLNVALHDNNKASRSQSSAQQTSNSDQNGKSEF